MEPPDPKLTPYAYALHAVRDFQRRYGPYTTLGGYHRAIEEIARSWGP